LLLDEFTRLFELLYDGSLLAFEPEFSLLAAELLEFAGSFLSVEPLFILLSDDEFTLPLSLLFVGSLVAVEALTVFSLTAVLLTLTLVLSFTTLPELSLPDEVPSVLILVAVAELSIVLPALTGTVGFLLVLELLSLLLPLVTIRALPAPLPYPPIEPRCP
jgi:hypothetical protein